MSYSIHIRRLFLAAAMLAMTGIVQAGVLVNENFDDGKWSDTGWGPWLQNTNCATGTTIGLSANARFRGAYGMDINYIIDDDPRGDCQLTQDNNTSLVREISPALQHYFVRGYLQIPVSTATLCQSPYVQRKLLYFKPTGWTGGTGPWAFFVNAWPWKDCATNGIYLSVGYIGVGGTGATLWGDDPSSGFVTTANHIYANKWYYIEVEVQYGSYGNDAVRIWLAPEAETPKLILDRRNLNLRSQSDVNNNLGLGSLEVGRQVNIVRSSFSQSVNERRYWDEIVVSTERIGPVQDVRPSAPKYLGVN